MTSRSAAAGLFAAMLGSVLVLAPRVARAQADVTIKPHLLFLLDSSGSMADPTGSTGPNSCGVTSRSKVNDLRCTMTNVLNNVTDAVIGIGRFRASNCSNTSCTGSSNTTWCRATDSLMLLYPMIDAQSGITVAGYTTDRNTIISDELRWFDFTAPTGACVLAGMVCGNFAGNSDISANSSTPLGGILNGALGYWQSGIASACTNCTDDREVDHINVASPIASDASASCRPRANILLTDGDETCSGNASTQATALRAITVGGQARPVLTYVIGFGTAVPYTPLENIAIAGGTTDARGGHRSFYARNESDLAVAISDIIADSQLHEYCNTVDDNCNAIVDEGYGVGSACSAGVGVCARTGVIQCAPDTMGRTGPTSRSTTTRCSATAGAPGTENTNATCSDGLDNDCDGRSDCADPDCAGTTICSGACVPTAEVCNGRDDDCDGVIDDGNPGGGTACGSNVGACHAGTTACVGGTIVCQGATGPATEVCDGIDNNCNGVADEGLQRACGSSVGACRPGFQNCVAGAYETTCRGSIGPSAEICDSIDNNCNGTTDEGNPGGGASCGAGMGVCTSGAIQCVSGALQCVGGRMPGVEVCNGLDDDCNGVVDDGIASTACTGGITFPSTPPVGTCHLGMTVCAAGATVCRGAVGPGTEVCNGLDDNCNGMVDEGLNGGACGSSVGACRAGTIMCVAGHESCVGSTGPAPETCDGIDNNCNGMTDEGNPGGGAPCGSNIGECVPGVTICTSGMLMCQGGHGATTEVCDGLDNDCDGMIDQGDPGGGGACGSSTGACMPGVAHCVSGHIACVGGRGPRTEECNCIDDDCDGMVDNPATGADGGLPSLCDDGAVCAGTGYCMCLRRCADTEFPCPVGRSCMNVGGNNLCVGDPCANVQCDDATQVCQNGSCHGRCEGVTCDTGLVCNPRNGQCVANDCAVLSNCTTGQICHGGSCISDPCAHVTCTAAQACYDGTCGATCDGVMCAAGQTCSHGACVAGDRCTGVTCASGLACIPATGMCASNRCTNRTCGQNQVCDPATGACGDDPCAVVHCPTGLSCARGECVTPGTMGTDAGMVDSGTATGGARDRVVGTGGGGFGCAVSTVGDAPGSRHGAGGLAMAAGAALATAMARRRARRRNGVRGGEVAR